MEESPIPKSEYDNLNSEVWRTYLTTGATLKGMQLPWFEHPSLKPVYRALPSEPRCQICYIPFEGIGGFISKRLLNVKPSALNPHMCDVCERFAERFPGGAEVEVTILFADIRGSTSLAEKMETRDFSELIHRFYLAGTKALYSNNALIEKFVGGQPSWREKIYWTPQVMARENLPGFRLGSGLTQGLPISGP
jgi:hypothetical protein